jgi:hypothetical protein
MHCEVLEACSVASNKPPPAQAVDFARMANKVQGESDRVVVLNVAALVSDRWATPLLTAISTAVYPVTRKP